VSFSFFSGFFEIRLTELQIDPQLESTIRPKARGLHSIWNVILRIEFSIWFLHQDNTSTIEDLQEKHSETLRDYSRRLQDYSKISWSTFHPRDDSKYSWELSACGTQGRSRTTRQGHQNYSKTSCSTTMYSRACRMDIPRPTTQVGTRTDYSVGPWNYSTWAARHLLAWSARITEGWYSVR
jgi:hypothetical protein